MKQLINKIHSLLLKNGATIAVAESCTGGILSELLTRNSGSSEYFLLGITSYSDKSKNKILKIPLLTITKYGAVSEKTAQKMAYSVKKLIKSDIGIGITGIAGPTGAVPGKPIGTVFIAISSPDKKICKRFQFKGNRAIIRKAAALQALKMIKQLII